MRAMILAAGYGSRLRPLTAVLPKPLVPVANRPLLWHIIMRLRACGIHEIVINLHYRGQQIREWLGTGEPLGVAVTYSEEPELLGSAGGARRVRDFFGNEPALLVHGDLLFDVDLGEVIRYHLSHQAHATLVLHPAHHRFNYGTIKVNAHGEIAQFVNAQAPWISGPLVETVFTGVQILDPRLLDRIPAERFAVLTTDLYPSLLTPASRVFGYLMQGYWSDIGTPFRYWQANMDAVRGRIAPVWAGLPHEPDPEETQPGRLPATSRLCPPVTLGSALRVGEGCCIGPETVVGEGCEMAEGVHIVGSVLWPRVRVGTEATIERSIIMSDVVIPARSHLSGKIVSPSGTEELAGQGEG
ncbi:MAG: NDP-sugar synthase [Nitrospinae bacterium]|nr:NDP-sugar synthase [Nitrospinota bacterium]